VLISDKEAAAKEKTEKRKKQAGKEQRIKLRRKNAELLACISYRVGNVFVSSGSMRTVTLMLL